MDSKFIEKLERRRYKYLLWQTIGIGLFIPGILINDWLLAGNAIARGNAFSLTFLIIGTALFVVWTLLASHQERRIRQNPELGKILNNELVVLYNYKSFKCAAYASIFTVIIILFLSKYWLTALTVPVSCIIILYITVLAERISRLVYLRK